MKTVLHIGAHRTGTTSFQAYLLRHRADLLRLGVACWGPWITRKGLFAGIQQPTAMARNSAMGRARGRLALRRHKIETVHGADTLIVSEENIMGAMPRNVRRARLYDDVGERVARFVAAFGGEVHKVVVTVRALDHYWSSAASHCAAFGHAVPHRAALSQMAYSARGWRDVITDIACAAPDAEIAVLPFERFAGRPDAQLSAILRGPVPEDVEAEWLNRRPSLARLRKCLSEREDTTRVLDGADDRWQPFQRDERDALRETYADDMFWLSAGADGLATLTEDWDRTEATRPGGPLTRGHPDDDTERRMAHPR